MDGLLQTVYKFVDGLIKIVWKFTFSNDFFLNCLCIYWRFTHTVHNCPFLSFLYFFVAEKSYSKEKRSVSFSSLIN
jgi:hypothetical protein